jgi:hypothetical protein
MTHVCKKVRMRYRSACVSICLLMAALAFGQADPAGSTPPAVKPEVTRAEEVRNESGAELPPPPTTLSSDQIKELIRQAAEKDIENDKKQKDYNYSEREEQSKLDSKGSTKSTEVRVYDVLEIYGEEAHRLISKDGKPLSEKDAAKEDEKIQKIIDKRKNESDSDREKRLKKEEKDREHDREFVREVADAYTFTYKGTENLQGRESYVIDAEPRPGFEPHTREGKILPKFRFRLWLDRAEDQWVKLDATCIDTVSFGLFIARIHQGSRILIETTRVNDEVWLPQHIAVHFDAKLALLKTIDMNLDLTYKDYKKFQSQSRIVGMEELKEQH